MGFLFFFSVLILLVILLFLITNVFPAVFANVAKVFERFGGWVVAVLGIGVLVFGMRGFMAKEGRELSSLPVVLYETIQLFFLNASPEGVNTITNSGDSQRVPEVVTKVTALDDESKPSTVKLTESKTVEQNNDLRWACFFAAGFVTVLALGAVTKLYHESFQSALLMLSVDHIVVCGYGRIGKQVVKSFLDSPRPELKRTRSRKIVIIDNSMSKVDKEWTERRGILVIADDATSSTILRRANVAMARDIFVTTGVDEENIEIAAKIREISDEFDQSRHPFAGFLRWIDAHCHLNTEVYVHILDQDIADIARRRLSAPGLKADSSVRGPSIRFRIFNALERTTRLLLEEIVSRGSKLIPSKNEVSHLVVFGFEEFGQSIVNQFAEQAHFENERRLRITVIEKEIEEKSAAFLAKHPQFSSKFRRANPFAFSVSDESWNHRNDTAQPSTVSEADPAVRYVCNVGFDEYTDVMDSQMLERMRVAFSENVKPIILVCFQDGNRNFSTAERLKARLVAEGINSEVFVWLADREELMSLAVEDGRPRAIPFGLCAKSVTYHEITDPWTEWLAKWINLAFDQAFANPPSADWKTLQTYFEKLRTDGHAALGEAKSAFENVQRLTEITWDNMNAKHPENAEEYRHSNRSAAIHAVIKLASVGLSVTGHRTEARVPRPCPCYRAKLKKLEDNLDHIISKMEHNRWNAERLLRGWTYGKKDEVKKQRPGLVPWNLLPHDERGKDHASIQILVDLCRFGAIQLECLTEGVRLHQLSIPDNRKMRRT